MKNTLKTQFAIAMVVSLFFGALGFVVDKGQVMAIPVVVASGPEAVQAKPMPVLARPSNLSFSAKAAFSLQGADVAGYLSMQSFSVQVEAGYAENLQGSAAAPLLANYGKAPTFSLNVQPLHLAVNIYSQGSMASGIWSSVRGLPELPPITQALAPALALVFLSIKIKPLSQKEAVPSGLQKREAFVFGDIFGFNRVLRC